MKPMKVDEIREIAKKRGLKPGKQKKAELVRAIQDAEGNVACYSTRKSGECGQDGCLWRDDCD
jgi:hypothetical protein